MNLHSSSSVNDKSSTPKDPLYKILYGLRSHKLWKEKKKKKKSGGNKSRRTKRATKKKKKKRNNGCALFVFKFKTGHFCPFM